MPNREVEVDVATALEGMGWVTGVHVLRAQPHVDAFQLAVVLSPFTQTSLVQVHYALVTATHGHDVPGRILYVDDAQPRPLPMQGARMVMPTPAERADARERIAERRAKAPVTVPEISEAFDLLAAQAGREKAEHEGSYRFPATIRWSLATGRILEVVKDPFAPDPERRRVLVADPDPQTARVLEGLHDVVHVTDGWLAVDKLTEDDFDLALCALVVGDLPGAKIHRLVAKNRPAMAARIYFLAAQETIASGPASSASGRILARPVTREAVERLLEQGR